MRFVMERNEPDRANCWHNGIRRWLLWWTIDEVQITDCVHVPKKSTRWMLRDINRGAYIKFVWSVYKVCTKSMHSKSLYNSKQTTVQLHQKISINLSSYKNSINNSCYITVHKHANDTSHFLFYYYYYIFIKLTNVKRFLRVCTFLLVTYINLMNIARQLVILI
jgi:hypothetical protein